MSDVDTMREQAEALVCPLCGISRTKDGKPFRSLAGHTSHAHQVSGKALRDLLGLTYKTPGFVTADLRARLRELAVDRFPGAGVKRPRASGYTISVSRAGRETLRRRENWSGPSPEFLDSASRGLQTVVANQKSKTHCRHGHPFTEDNTFIRQSPSHKGLPNRGCRTCQRTRQREAKRVARADPAKREQMNARRRKSA